ncbi:MAG: histidine kinase [Myxococcota bacterium]
MDFRLLTIEIAEKISLLATAGLFSVLVPPLRNRLLGVGGQPRDRLVALILGYLLAMWGAKMGIEWMGVHVHLAPIGVLMAAILGGARVGLVTGLLAGLFTVYRVDDALGGLGVAASTLDGVFASIIAEREPKLLQGWRTFFTASAMLLARGAFIATGLAATGGDAGAFLSAWPALLVMLLANAAGITIFVVTARLVLQREETAVALAEARGAADQAALVALRRRLEPHFLFNALNTLRATIRRNPDRARDLVSDLADLYRYLLHHGEDALLREEVEHAESYLAIERARLGEERLSVEAEPLGVVGDARVPALLLQPIVENAVKHGVAAREGGGVVTMRARREEGRLVVEVEDAGRGERLGPPEKGSGIALETLRARLARRFAGKAALDLEPTPTGMLARLTLPWDEVAPPVTSPGARSAA